MYSENRKPKYRFILDNGDTATIVTPNYAESQSLKTKLQTGEFYYRDTLTGELTFLRDDIAKINDVDFDVNFSIALEEDTGDGFSRIWLGKFVKTDCEFDDNRHGRKIVVTPEADDQYTLFEAGLEKEFDIIELGIDSHSINYVRQPLLQVYTLGGGFITNFVSGMSWEQEVDDNTLSSFVLEDEYRFANRVIPDAGGGSNSDVGNKLFVTGVGAGLVPDVSGVYNFPEYDNALYKYDPAFLYFNNRTLIVEVPISTSLHDFDDFGSSWHDSNGKQYEFYGIVDNGTDTTKWAYFKGTSPIGTTPTNGVFTHFSGATNTGDVTYSNAIRDEDQVFQDDYLRFNYKRYGIYRKSDDFCEYLTETYLEDFEAVYNDSTFPAQLQIQSSRTLYSRTSNSKTKLIWGAYFCRVFCDLETLEDNPTYEVPTGEVIPSPKGYTRVYPFDFNRFVIQDDHNSIGGRLGTFDSEAANFAGEFFSEGNGNYINAVGYPDIQYLPVNRREWKDAAHFMAFTPRIWDIMNQGNTNVLLRHAYAFHEIIQLLLTQIDDRLTFDNTPEYSEFLYSGVNPVANEDQPNLWLTPKSNILQGNYDKPAAKAEIKLSDILTTWKVVYKGGFHITDDFKLRLEHSSWYEKGGSYGDDVVGEDLVGKVNLRNKKRSDFGQDIFTYDKGNIPEQIRTRFMDYSSEVFQGSAIEVLSSYAQAGNIKELSASVVTTDLDFAQTQPNSMSRDGWFMLATFSEANGVERVPFVQMDLGLNRLHNVQNGHLSFAYLHDRFYRDDMPAEDLVINNAPVTANSVQRNKVQRVEYSSNDQTDPMQLIKTIFGNAKLQEKTRNITTSKINSIVKHHG